MKKKFQLLHVLENPCDEAEEETLIRAAFAADPRKVVIKRPVRGGHLAGIKPLFDYGQGGTLRRAGSAKHEAQ